MKTAQVALLLAIALLALSSEMVPPPLRVAAELTCSKVIGVGRPCNGNKCGDACDRLQAVNSECGGAGCRCIFYCNGPPTTTS